MSPELTVVTVILFATMVQTLAGFGSALVSMPILAQVLGVGTAAPTFALIVTVIEIFVIARHRQSFQFSGVWRLMLAAMIGIPLGIVSAEVIPEQVMLFLLGCIVLAYAIYALITPRIPRLSNKSWAFGFGFFAGILTGAYNTGGPPYVMYGTSQGWEVTEFKANIQSLFLVGSTTVIIAHFANGNITSDVLRYAFLGLPSVAIGLLVGFYLERFVNPAAFRKLVLILLLFLGASLIL